MPGAPSALLSHQSEGALFLNSDTDPAFEANSAGIISFDCSRKHIHLHLDTCHLNNSLVTVQTLSTNKWTMSISDLWLVANLT